MIACLGLVLLAGCGSLPWDGRPTGASTAASPIGRSAPSIPPSSSPMAAATQVPTPSPTATPQPTASPPPRTPFGFAARRMRGEVMAFVRADDLAYARDTLDLATVSTVVFFSLSADAAGHLGQAGSGWRAWTSAAMDAVLARAHRAGVKVVFSLARFAWDSTGIAVSATLLASAEARARLAREAAAEVVRRGVDGINVDFEPLPAGRAAAFDDFVKRLRAELDRIGPGYQLTVDVVGHFDSYDVPGLVAAGADAIYLMGYHYAGWWSKVATSTAPYGGSGYDVTAAVRSLRRNVPASKLIVGVPYYGHLWPTASGAAFARTTGQGADILLKDAVTIAAAHGLRHEPTLHAAWSAWQERACATCAPGWVQLWFDDAQTLAWKWDWIRHEGLLGTGIWTSPFEGSPGAVTAALLHAFGAASP